MATALQTLAPLPARWQCDLSDDSLSWTPGVFELFGISQSAPLDRTAIVRMYSDESRVLLERLRGEAIASCGSFTFEARIVRPDGEARWMRVSADVACRNGRAALLYGSKHDITAEMRG